MAQVHAIKASLFVTCIIDQFFPAVGESTTRVLKRLGVDLDFPREQTCCGQPAFNAGFWNEAKPLARRFLKTFSGDRYIVVPSGSCASMVRVFYSELLHDDPSLSREIGDAASRVYEFSEFIVNVLGITDLGRYTDKRSPGRKVTYHEGCHLRRELGVLTEPRMLINSLPNVELMEMEQSEVCCGFGGVFSIKYPEISAAMLQDKIDNISKTRASSIVSCDNSCLMQIKGGIEKQGLEFRTMHLAQLLDEFIGVG